MNMVLPVLRWGERGDGQWRWHPRRCGGLWHLLLMSSSVVSRRRRRRRRRPEAELVCGEIGSTTGSK